MNKPHRQNLFSIERIFDLMTHPDMTVKQFCEKWEVSRPTYYRYKAYIKDRLFLYKVTRVERKEWLYTHI